MKLSHFSKAPLAAAHSVAQTVGEYRSCFDKPSGLWVSVDGEDDWPSWCRDNECADWVDGARYEIELAFDHRLLILTRGYELMAFTHEYGKPDNYGSACIDWPAVAARHRGIIIAPYQWSWRMELRWYYGWDCASGCIWNAEAIARIGEWREAPLRTGQIVAVPPQASAS